MAETSQPASETASRVVVATRENVTNITAFLLLLLYCFGPVAVSLTLLTQADASEAGYKFGLALMQSDAGQYLNALLAPILGAVTIFRSERISSGWIILMIITVLLAFSMGVLALGSASDPKIIALYQLSEKDVPGFLRGFLEKISFILLVLIGIRKFDSSESK
jgi:hypothetical protein